MKVILSKKGFDSKYGGIASPIMPDGTLLSLPIPTAEEKAGIKYSNLKYKGNGKTYKDIITELNHGKPLDINKCHLDPDIRKKVGIERNNWIPAFGQSRGSQTHLENEGVTEGDLFLFFGRFRQTEYVKGKLHYTRNEKVKNIIFGYLQIYKIYTTDKIVRDLPKKLRYHPHYLNRKHKDYKKTNAIYGACDKLSFIDIPGSGCFKYDKKLILTKEGEFNLTQWELPSFFKDQNIQISGIKDPYKKNHFQACKGYGQEFVIQENIEDNKILKEWVKKIIKAGTKAK